MKNPPKGFEKLATSPTREGIEKAIARYYYGPKELRASDTPGRFTVHNADGRRLSPVVWETERGFYFGTESA